MTYPRLVVFSNADGVLREPASTPVTDAVGLLGRANTPLVLCSGRTRAEIEHISLALGMRHPFICEHGAALFVPRGYFPVPIASARDIAGYDVVEFGRSYDDVVDVLRRTAARIGVDIRGFSDMPVDEVAQECALPLLTARLAKLRDYREAFRIVGDVPGSFERLAAALDAARLSCVRGNRYHHVGSAVDIGLGVSILTSMFERAWGPTRYAAVSGDPGTTLARIVKSTVVLGHETPNAWAACLQELLEAPAAPPNRMRAETGRATWTL